MYNMCMCVWVYVYFNIFQKYNFQVKTLKTQIFFISNTHTHKQVFICYYNYIIMEEEYICIFIYIYRILLYVS